MVRQSTSISYIALVVALLCVVCPASGAVFGRANLQLPKRPEISHGVTAARSPMLAYVDAVSRIEDMLNDHVPTMIEAGKDFMMGAVSGAIASFSVFPIDLAKTRMQDQRVVAGAEVLYKNAFQTMKKVATDEGIPALYRGVVPVVLGSAPEAALQLGGDVAARKFFTKKLNMKNGETLPLWAEIISGGVAGISQVLASNPMERVKILQQVGAKGSIFDIAKALGPTGLYQVKPLPDLPPAVPCLADCGCRDGTLAL